jgi:glucose-6-phosphate isomerase
MGSAGLTLDINDAMFESLGASGLERSEIAALSDRSNKIHSDLAARRRSGALGFFDLPFDAQAAEESIAVGRALSAEYENVVVMGIGGSSLGPKALFTALSHPLHNLLPRAKRGGARLFFPDNSDPATFAALLETLELSKTGFLAITKSGGTAETWSQLLILRERLIQEHGQSGFRKRVLAVTDPSKGALRSVAKAEGLRTLPVPPSVGGRFSVLTAVGLAPAAAAGIDVKALLAGAAQMAKRCEAAGVWENPAYLWAAVHFLMERSRQRSVHVLMPYADALRELGDWFVQLWAESLGKKSPSGEVGPTPLRAVGATDQHSLLQLLMEGPPDKLVTFVALESPRADLKIPAGYPQEPDVAYLGGHTLFELLSVEQRATAAALAKVGRPSVTLRLPALTPEALGELIYFFEVATAFAGGLYEVNPFDQPGVEAGKRFACGILGRPGYEKDRAEVEARPARKSEYVI